MDKYVNKYKNESGATVYYIKETSCCGKRTEWIHGEADDLCPHCGNKYFRKPNLENKLFCLQDEFLKDYEATGSTRILGEKMFPLIHEYAVNLIKALIKGKISLDYDDLSAKAWDASTLLIEVIMKDPEHRMRYSFGKYLGDLCKSVCYSTKNHEQTYSLNSLLTDGKTMLEETITVKLDDTNEVHIKNSVEFDAFREDTLDKVIELVRRTAGALFSVTNSYADKILYLQGLLLKFRLENDNILAGFYEEAGRSLKNYVEKGELIIFSELKELVG